MNTKYKLPPASVAMIGGGLLYFILPADLIPDFIPVIGYLDDLAVLTTIMNSLNTEIRDYRIWKNNKSRSGAPPRLHRFNLTHTHQNRKKGEYAVKKTELGQISLDFSKCIM